MAASSVAHILGDIVGNVQEITRSEIRLVKTELREEAGRAIAAAGITSIGLLLTFYGVGLVLVAAFVALTLAMPAWTAAIVLAVPVGAIGALLIQTGVKRLRTLSLKPEKTIETVKENLEWLKTQTK